MTGLAVSSHCLIFSLVFRCTWCWWSSPSIKMKIAIRGTTRRKSGGAMAAPETSACSQNSDNIRLPYIGEYEQPCTPAISLLIAMETELILAALSLYLWRSIILRGDKVTSAHWDGNKLFRVLAQLSNGYQIRWARKSRIGFWIMTMSWHTMIRQDQLRCSH